MQSDLIVRWYRSILPLLCGIVRAGANVRHSADADEVFEVIADELRSVVRYDSRFGVRVRFPSPLQDGLHIPFLHLFANLPMNDGPAIAVDDAGHIVKRATDIEI